MVKKAKKIKEITKSVGSKSLTQQPNSNNQ